MSEEYAAFEVDYAIAQPRRYTVIHAVPRKSEAAAIYASQQVDNGPLDCYGDSVDDWDPFRIRSGGVALTRLIVMEGYPALSVAQMLKKYNVIQEPEEPVSVHGPVLDSFRRKLNEGRPTIALLDEADPTRKLDWLRRMISECQPKRLLVLVPKTGVVQEIPSSLADGMNDVAEVVEVNGPKELVRVLVEGINKFERGQGPDLSSGDPDEPPRSLNPAWQALT